MLIIISSAGSPATILPWALGMDCPLAFSSASISVGLDMYLYKNNKVSKDTIE